MMQVRRTVFAVATAAFVSLTNSAAFAHSDPLTAVPTTPAANAKLEAVSGTVREVVIEDHVAGMTMRHLSMVASNGEAVALAGKQVDQLVAGQAISITGRRNGNRFFVDTVSTGKASAAAIPEQVHAEGKLAVAHVDNFETGKSGFIYEVRGDDGSVTGLQFAVAPEALQAGMRIRAHGGPGNIEGSLTPSRVEILALAPSTSTESTSSTTQALTTKATTYHKVLVVAVKFADTASDPLPISSVQSLMNTASTSVANFFREVSYGQHQLSATVPGAWLRANIATPTTCNYSAISTAGDAAATAAGYSPSSYEFKVYMFPRVPACGWSGLGYVGFPRLAYINGPTSMVTNVIGHEMGHNFGLLHAASVDCGARSVGGACTASEYGDPFNTMGNLTSMHYDAAQKALLGWISSAAVKTHTTGSATYTLSPLETAGGAVYAIKIPAATKRTYWLEYRQPIGFDAGLASYPNNGAQIRVASPFETLCSGCDSGNDDTELLDLTTGTAPFTDATLTVGKRYTDPDYGFTINVISATPSALTVQVSAPGSAPPPGPTSTSSTIASSANPSTVGANVTLTATINGTSPTGTVSFNDAGVALAGCSAVAVSGSGNTRTAVCNTSSLAAGTHSISARYSGDAANLTSTSSPLAQVMSTTVVASSNVALASAGATATASSAASATGYAPSIVINGDHKGLRTSTAAGWWMDATPYVCPDWVQVNFKGAKTITQAVVYSLQDNYSAPVDPSATMTFKNYGVVNFTVQGWTGSAWVTLATVTGNTLVKRTVTFASFTTDRIRINMTKSANAYTRLVEVEVWGK